MLIRTGVATDAAELAALHLQVWREAYTGLVPEAVLAQREAIPEVERVTRWVGWLRSDANDITVAVDDDRVVGWASMGPSRDPDLDGLELWSIYVAAAHYSTGLGHQLLEAAIGDAAASVWVLRGNERAIRFYERHGFAFDGTEQVDELGLTELRMRRAGI